MNLDLAIEQIALLCILNMHNITPLLFEVILFDNRWKFETPKYYCTVIDAPVTS